MADKKSGRTHAAEHDIDGHRVRVVGEAGREELWIDGTRRRFFRNSGGYVLFENAYVPARASLLDAVRDYLAQADDAGPAKKRGGR